MFASPRIDISGLATSADCCLETDTEADVVLRCWGAVAAGGRTQVAPVLSRSRPEGHGGARSWTLRIGLCSRTVCCVPVRCPLPHIAVHIKKAPRVGTRISPHQQFVQYCCYNSHCWWLSITPRVRRGRACSAGILPLRFRGQYIRPTRRDIAGLLRIQTGEEFLDIIPGYFFHRTVSVVRPVGSAWHSAHQYSPSSPPRTGPG